MIVRKGGIIHDVDPKRLEEFKAKGYEAVAQAQTTDVTKAKDAGKTKDTEGGK